MDRKRESYGLSFELVGLLVIFVASFWQLNVTEWFDFQMMEWQSSIQEDVNLTILHSLNKFNWLILEEDRNIKNSISIQISQNISDGLHKVIKQREKRKEAIETGQYNTFSWVRKLLLLLGAGFLIIGKWITLTGVRQKPSDAP
jgi:hypothetical protein